MEAEKTIDKLIWVDKDRVSGQPCFYGTRVPVSILFEYLRSCSSLADFLKQYPSVSMAQATGVVELSEKGLGQLIQAA